MLLLTATQYHASLRGWRDHCIYVLLVNLLWAALIAPTAAPAPYFQRRLVRREASPPPATTDSNQALTEAPPDQPPGAPQVVSPGGGPGPRGQRGASPPLSGAGDDVGEQEGDEQVGSTANLAQPVESGSGGSDGLHPGIIVVLSLVCVFLFVLVLVCAAALIRYTLVQRKKGRHTLQSNGVARPDSCLWTEGARYSPATPGTYRPRHKAASRRQRDKATDLTRASHISTELYRAVYPYNPSEDSQLKLEAGSVVDVVEKTEGWWRGFAGPREGWFPANYVERVYEVASSVTLEDYTDDMGGRHSRHQRQGGRSSAKNRLSSSTITHSTVTQVNSTNSNSTNSNSLNTTRNSGLSTGRASQADFQAARRHKAPKPPVSPEYEVTIGDSDVTQPMVPQIGDVGAHEEVIFSDELTLGRPKSGGSNAGEENLLQSIFSDLEKVWSNSQVSTPIDKDYYKLQPLESSLQPIPLSESFSEDVVKKKQLLHDHDDHEDASTTDPDQLIASDVAKEIEAEFQAEDTYMNCDQERQIVEVQEDMYINCQTELHEAVKDEEVAQDEMDGVTHGFDKILQDLVSKEQQLEVDGDLVSTHQPVVAKISSSTHTTPSSSVPTSPLDISYRAMYAYTPRQVDELHITAEEILVHVSHVSDDWVKVRNSSGKEGLVPVIYVAPKDLNSPQHLGGRSPDSDEWDVNDFDNDMEGDITAIEYVALYDYTSQQEGDLVLGAGDRVAVIETVDSGWWKGYSNGREGWFPAAYVQMCAESVPSTPAATITAAPSQLADLGIIQKEQGSSSSSSEDDGDEDDDVPPPLPSCPPPTDEELEELELKLREQSEQLQREKDECKELLKPEDEEEEFLTPVAAVVVSTTAMHREKVVPAVRNERKLKESEVNLGNSERHGIAREVVDKPTSETVYIRTSDVPTRTEERKNITQDSEIEPSPPRLLRPPVGFGGSDARISTGSESEPESFRSKFGKRFGKPKFVKIPKNILPQMRRVGSAGKRPAPPAPAHARLEISAPILQQSSDPMRIAASYDVAVPRVSFQEPVANNSQSREVEKSDREHNSSPGILKNRKVFIYKGSLGGSYEDMMDKQNSKQQIQIINKNHVSIYDVPPKNVRPVSQVSNSSMRSNSSRNSDQHQTKSVQLRNPASYQNQNTSSAARADEKKTPPPRPRPIAGTPMSAPQPGQRAAYRPPLEESLSLSHSPPTQHYSSGGIYRQSSVGGAMEGRQEFTPEPQPMRGRRRSHRPSAPPPPRPKVPPPPRPQGPPPGRVGAHGDGIHTDTKRLSGNMQQVIEDQNDSHTLDYMQPLVDNSTDKDSVRNSKEIATSHAIVGQRAANTYVMRDMANKGTKEVHKQTDQDQFDNLTFTVPKGILNTSRQPVQLSSTDMSSHLTESSDYDEVDFSESRFEIITMKNPSKMLNAGPRDSFRKYKKQHSGGKRTSLNENVHLDDNSIPLELQSQQAQIQARKAKSQSLTCAPGARSVSIRGDDLYAIHHYNKPRSLTLGRAPVMDEWSNQPQSPTKKNAPPRPPPPVVSPGSPQKKFPTTSNGDALQNTRCEKPMKPPRKDKLRRSTETYAACEKGELSFDEDIVIRDIGEVSLIPDRPGWSVGLLEDGMIGVYPTSAAVTVTLSNLLESD